MRSEGKGKGEMKGFFLLFSSPLYEAAAAAEGSRGREREGEAFTYARTRTVVIYQQRNKSSGIKKERKSGAGRASARRSSTRSVGRLLLRK